MLEIFTGIKVCPQGDYFTSFDIFPCLEFFLFENLCQNLKLSISGNSSIDCLFGEFINQQFFLLIHLLIAHAFERIVESNFYKVQSNVRINVRCDKLLTRICTYRIRQDKLRENCESKMTSVFKHSERIAELMWDFLSHPQHIFKTSHPISLISYRKMICSVDKQSITKPDQTLLVF